MGAGFLVRVVVFGFEGAVLAATAAVATAAVATTVATVNTSPTKGVSSSKTVDNPSVSFSTDSTIFCGSGLFTLVSISLSGTTCKITYFYC